MLSLLFSLEAEAKKIVDILRDSSSSHVSLAYSFLRYYTQQENWLKAVTLLEESLDSKPSINPNKYNLIIDLCKKAKNIHGERKLQEKFFLAYPSLELFKNNLALITNHVDKEFKIENWIDILRKQKRQH